MSRPILTGAILASLLAAAPAGAADPMPQPDCHGIQITDKAGDSANALAPSQTGSPSSDLTAGFVTYDAATGKATANIRVAELTIGEVDAPYVAIGWEMAFTAGKAQRYVRAYQDRFGFAKYSWGEPRAITDDQTEPRAGGETTGALHPGKDGIIAIDIPLADMGIAPGTDLRALSLEVRQWLSLPAAVPSTGLPLFYPAPIYDEATGRGSVTLAGCDPAPLPDPTVPPPPQVPAGEEPGAQPPPAAAPSRLEVKVTVPKLKARKLKRGKRFTVKLRGTATKLVGQLRTSNEPDAKVLATGKLRKLDGRGRMRLKVLKRVRKGRYVLAFVGRNADGAPAEGVIGVRVR